MDVEKRANEFVVVRRGVRIVGGFVVGIRRYRVVCGLYDTALDGSQEFPIVDECELDGNGEPSQVARCYTLSDAEEWIRSHA